MNVASRNDRPAASRVEGRTRALCAFLSRLALEDVPRDVVDRVKDLLVDHFGVALLGARQPATVAIRDTMAGLDAKDESTVYGMRRRAGRATAALANATAAYSASLDDTHNPSLSHPGAVVIATALAMAEARDAGAREFLAAIVAGYEAQGRIGAAASKAIDRGFHPIGIAGVFGAAAAAGRVLRLDEDRMQSAFGIALSFASGTMQFARDPRSTVKRLHAGWAAHAGLLAAELAAGGVAGPRDAVEGETGLVAVFGGGGDAEGLDAGLGASWEVARVSIKVHACCRLFHAAIDALEACRAKAGFESADVAKIEVGLPSSALVGHMQYRPESTASAQYSLPYSMAAALLFDSRDPASYAEALLARPEVVALMDRVLAVAEPALDRLVPERFPGRVRIALADGRVVEEYRADSLGTAEFPVDSAAIAAKFAAVLKGIAGEAWQRSLIREVRGLDEGSEMRRLGELLREVAPQ